MPKNAKKIAVKRPAGKSRSGNRSGVSSGRASGLGALPEWNLDDLYSGLDDPAIKRDLDRVAAECAAFEDAYKGKLAEWLARQKRTQRIIARASPERCAGMRKSTI